MKRTLIFAWFAVLGMVAGFPLAQMTPVAQAQEHNENKHAQEPTRDVAAEDEKHEQHTEQDELAEQGDEDDHAGHGEQEEENKNVGLDLTADVLREFDVRIEPATDGRMENTIRLPGEVVYNADAVTHVTPPVAGIVQKANVSVGDRVSTGDVMAVLNSRELAAARSDYLAAKARLTLAEENMTRDRRLFEEKVGSERALIASRQALEEANIVLRQAENTLHALGYSHENIARISEIDEAAFNLYELRAPISGIVTSRHLTLGEVIDPGKEAPFVVADLSTVWVNITVYQRDLAHVQAGQEVEIEFGHGIPDARGRIEFVSPAVDQATRTAFARVVLENPKRVWRPGIFVTGIIGTGHDNAEVVVPRSAVIGLDGKQVVFIQTKAGLVPREVQTGRVADDLVEIVSGLRPGERFAYGNVLTLKAEINRGALEHAGHAH